MARARILRHAADCVVCRRQLAIASLSPIGPLRATVEGFLGSARLSVCAGLALGVVVLWFLHADAPSEEPASKRPPRVAVARPRPQPASRPREASAPERDQAGTPAVAPETAHEDGKVAPPEERSGVEALPDAPAAPAFPQASPTAPRRLDSVAEAPKPPSTPPAVKASDSEVYGRLAILDPFGSLALEGAGGRQPVQGSRVVPVEARLTAVGRASGFRLGDGLRVQLAPGSSISIFQNTTRRCPGLAVLQGALLLESSQPHSVYLKREETSGVLDGMNGPVAVSAGVKPDSLTVQPLGASTLAWKRAGAGAVDIAPGDALGIDGGGQELLSRTGKSKAALARFVGWPEPSSLFYSSFEDGVQGLEQPGIVQGASKEGYVSAALAGGKGRRTIELTLPASIQTLPPDAVLRLRLRTTAARIQCGLGGNGSRTAPITVTQRNRSETVWTTLSFAFSALDQDGHRGRGAGGRPALRGNLMFVAEAPSRISAEELVFDIDEIEITRS